MNKRTVLLIDDSSTDNYINRRMISSYNFAETVLEFQDPGVALSYLRELANKPGNTNVVPDFIFLDLSMPHMEGIDFLTEFELLPPRLRDRIRIIVLSGSSHPGKLMESTKNPHVLTFVNKPLIKMNLDFIESILEDERNKTQVKFKEAG